MNILISVLYLIVAVILFVFLLVMSKKNESKGYDERQRLLRSKAYQLSYFLLLSYCCMCALLDFSEIKWVSAQFQATFAVLMSSTVFIVSCILYGAFGDLKTVRYKVYFSLLTFIGLSNIVMFIFRAVTLPETMVENGLLSDYFLNLGCGLSLIAIGIAAILYSVKSKKEAEEE